MDFASYLEVRNSFLPLHQKGHHESESWTSLVNVPAGALELADSRLVRNKFLSFMLSIAYYFIFEF